MENNAEICDIIARIDEKKKKLDSFRPLPRELVQNLEEWFAVDYTYNSNAIEGNTLSLSETAIVVEKGITIGGKTIREHLEAINHIDAIGFIKSLAHISRTNITTDDILTIHKIVLQRIDDRNAGIFRTINVRITGSSTIFPNSAKVPFLIISFMQWLHAAIEHPIIIAALAHFELVSIHPFVDGNGRTSRLLMNLLLLQTGYPFAIIKNENRSAYIKAIEVARKTDNCNDFCMIVAQAVEESMDIYLNAIKDSL